MYVIVDIETTGGNAKNGKITEIAIYKHDGEKLIDEFVSLVNPECYIPPYITGLTGITNEMVENSPTFYQIAKQIVEICDGATFVAHNAAFDYGFIQAEFKALGFDFVKETICTVKLSRKLLPGYDSYSLGNLCQELGISISARHRAAGDAFATVALFELLIQKNGGFILPENPYSKFSVEELHPNLTLNFIKSLPEEVGVYYFHNDVGEVIYVGKSTNIKRRVLTHLVNPKTKKGIEMKRKIADISVVLTGSEIIALLKESQEIKELTPIYNRALRRKKLSVGLYTYFDRKGYRRLHLQTIDGNNHPEVGFLNFSEARERLLDWVEEYCLCQKLAGLYEGQNGCFQYQIKSCYGACVGEESADDYNKRVNQLLRKFTYDISNAVIIDKGREDDESSIVVIENGVYLGYGYFPHDEAVNSPDEFKDYIQRFDEDRDARSILLNYLSQKKYRKIITY